MLWTLFSGETMAKRRSLTSNPCYLRLKAKLVVCTDRKDVTGAMFKLSELWGKRTDALPLQHQWRDGGGREERSSCQRAFRLELHQASARISGTWCSLNALRALAGHLLQVHHESDELSWVWWTIISQWWSDAEWSSSGDAVMRTHQWCSDALHQWCSDAHVWVMIWCKTCKSFKVGCRVGHWKCRLRENGDRYRQADWTNQTATISRPSDERAVSI